MKTTIKSMYMENIKQKPIDRILNYPLEGGCKCRFSLLSTGKHARNIVKKPAFSKQHKLGNIQDTRN